MRNDSSRSFLPGHALLRGLAAIAVFLAHADFSSLWADSGGLAGDFYRRLFDWHNPAVDIFFVLSGFILFHVHPPGSPAGWQAYFAARIGKIYPLFIATTLFTTALFVAGALRNHAPPFGQTPPLLLAANLLGVQQWMLRGSELTSINLPAWSISVELLLYLSAFPILRLVLRNFSIPRSAALVTCSVLLALTSSIAVLGHGDPSAVFSSPIRIARGFLGFTAGALLYHAGARPGNLSVPTSFFVASVALFLASAFDLLPRDFLPLLSLPLVYSVSFANRFFEWSPFREVCVTMGNLSYGIYLLHFPVIKFLRMVVGVWDPNAMTYRIEASLPQKILFIGLALALTIAGAALSHRYYEEPVRKWIRKNFGRPRSHPEI